MKEETLGCTITCCHSTQEYLIPVASSSSSSSSLWVQHSLTVRDSSLGDLVTHSLKDQERLSLTVSEEEGLRFIGNFSQVKTHCLEKICFVFAFQVLRNFVGLHKKVQFWLIFGYFPLGTWTPPSPLLMGKIPKTSRQCQFFRQMGWFVVKIIILTLNWWFCH